MLHLALLAITVAPLARSHAVLFEQEGMIASLYYDLTNKYCAEALNNDPVWAETSNINSGIPFCSGQQAVSLRDLGVNNIVAMNRDWVRADPDKWCGKEVQITDAQGNLFESSTGPLFIWDACEECARTPRVDLSGPAMNELQGGSCTKGLVPGLHLRVLDNNIWKKEPLGGRDPSFTGESGTPEGHGPPVVGPGGSSWNASISGSPLNGSAVLSTAEVPGVPPSASPNTSPPALPVPSPETDSPGTVDCEQAAGCTYGAERCAGGKAQKCNYVDGVTHETAWVDLGPCVTQRKRRKDQV